MSCRGSVLVPPAHGLESSQRRRTETDAALSESTPAWHGLSIESVLEELGTDRTSGLTDGEAAGRLARLGANELAPSSGPSSLELLIGQFNNVLVWVLLVAAFISGALLQEWIDTVVILAIVILNAVLGFTQESRAERALVELAAMASPSARVVRSGRERSVPVTSVVAGDLVQVEAGDWVPADARLLEAVHLQTDEASLTGESLPVTKHNRPLAPDLATSDRRNMLFGGTIVAAGRGTAVVTDTGSGTVFGQVAKLLDVSEPATPLEVELDRVGKTIGIAALVIAVVIFGLGVLRQIPAETMFLIAVALAVAAIPEGLSAVVTVTLSRGVSAMARQNAIVRRLPAVEALGATTVICTDKTGTLTQNKMHVQELEFAGVRTQGGDVRVEGTADGRALRYAQIVSLCSDARVVGGVGAGAFEGDPTEVALLASVDPVIVSVEDLRAEHPRLDEAAFDATRKRMSTLHRAQDQGFVVFAKGAPEVIIQRCSHFEDLSAAVPLGVDRRNAAISAADRMAMEGLRTLAVAYRFVDAAPAQLADAEQDLTLVAVVGMSDQVRPEAADAVALAHRAGIRIVMVTGDHEVTAAAIAKKLGIAQVASEVLGGTELRTLDHDALARHIDRYSVFARVEPADKVAIVKAWQQSGAIVAMTGDGVNDAPALRSADVGIAMGSGTAVARESSAMVLADDNFSTIVNAVAHGRAIFANLQKVVYFLLASNSAEVLVMLLGFLAFGSLGEPLLATQLLWINLVTDGLPALALGVDPPAPGLMDRAPERDHRFLGRNRQKRLLWQGAVLAAAALCTFAYGYWMRDLAFEEARTLLFTALVSVQLLHTYNVRAEGTTLRRKGARTNWLLSTAIGASLLLQVTIVYTAAGQRLFDTTSIDPVDWLAIAGFALLGFVAIRVTTGRELR